MFAKQLIKPLILLLFLFTYFILHTTSAWALDSGKPVAFGKLILNQEQISSLEELLKELIEKRNDIEIQVEDRLVKIGQELQRSDRFDTESKEKESGKKVGMLAMEVSGLYGRFLKTKVEYILKAKNILTLEQRAIIIDELNYFDDNFVDDYPEILEFSILDLPLDLTNDQIKKILKTETDLEVYILKINLKIDYLLLDLQEELLKDTPDSKKVDKYITKIVEIGAKYIDKRVHSFLKSKSVLTPLQKKVLIHALMM